MIDKEKSGFEAEVADVANRLHVAIRFEMRKDHVTSSDVLLHALAAATAMIVSYSSAPRYMNELATAIKAKERIRILDVLSWDEKK